MPRKLKGYRILQAALPGSHMANRGFPRRYEIPMDSRRPTYTGPTIVRNILVSLRNQWRRDARSLRARLDFAQRGLVRARCNLDGECRIQRSRHHAPETLCVITHIYRAVHDLTRACLVSKRVLDQASLSSASKPCTEPTLIGEPEKTCSGGLNEERRATKTGPDEVYARQLAHDREPPPVSPQVKGTDFRLRWGQSSLSSSSPSLEITTATPNSTSFASQERRSKRFRSALLR